MSFTEVIPRAHIEREARAAAAAGHPLDHACPYPFASDAGRCFRADYLAALEALNTAATAIATASETP